MTDIDLISDGLTLDPAGYWIAPGTTEFSYPPEGNDFCMSVEDSSFWFAHRNRVIVAAVKRFPPQAAPLLDIGAGNGYVAAALSRTGINVIPIEPNRAGAGNAVHRGLSPVICGSLPGPALRKRSAGGIGLFDVVEHISKDRDFLASLRPYLTDGGRLYLTTPAHQFLWSSDDVAAGHYRRYSLKTLCATIGAAGFDIEYATYIFAWLPLPTFLFRRIPSLLRRHSSRGFVASSREHTAGGKVIRRILEGSLSFEVGLVARGRRIPFGASCLVVARAQ